MSQWHQKVTATIDDGLGAEREPRWGEVNRERELRMGTAARGNEDA